MEANREAEALVEAAVQEAEEAAKSAKSKAAVTGWKTRLAAAARAREEAKPPTQSGKMIYPVIVDDNASIDLDDDVALGLESFCEEILF